MLDKNLGHYSQELFLNKKKNTSKRDIVKKPRRTKKKKKGKENNKKMRIYPLGKIPLNAVKRQRLQRFYFLFDVFG